MSNLKIGPGLTTKNRSGAVNVSCELPGEISLSCDDPNVTLSASSHTVSGTHDVSLLPSMQWGLANRADPGLRDYRSGVSIACRIFFKTRRQASGTGYQVAILNSSQLTSSGWHWTLSVDAANRKIGLYSDWGGGLQTFAHVFTADTEEGFVLNLDSGSATLYWSGGSETLSRTAINTVPAGYGSILRVGGGVGIVQCRDLQILNALSTAGQRTAYFGGGVLSDSLLCRWDCREESGDTAYDQGSAGLHLAPDTASTAPYNGYMTHSSPFQRVLSGMAGTEADITWSVPDDYEPGSFTITATRQKAGFPASIATETDTCTIVFSGVDAEGVTLDRAEISVEIGDSETLVATVWPADASEKGVSWSSSDMGVATVLNGVVSAVGRGSTVITVETVDGGFTASCAVTVPAADPVFGDVVENTLPALLPRALQSEYNSRVWANVWQERFNAETTGLVDVLKANLAVYDVENQTSAVLDAIADSFGVFGWEYGASLTEKRVFLAKVLEIQRKIGTPWAIEQAIRLLIPATWIDHITIIEGAGGYVYDGTLTYDGSEDFDSDFHWARFSVEIGYDAGTGRQAAMEALRVDLTRVINHYKPVRCQLCELILEEVV